MRTWQRGSLEEVLDQVVSAGFRVVQFNFSSAGFDPMPHQLTSTDVEMIAEALRARRLEPWGVSATFNAIHPDPTERDRLRSTACQIISLAPVLGATAVSLSTGTRDPANTWRWHRDNSSRDAWRDLLQTMEILVEAADAAHVLLGVEPEPANVVADAALAERLLRELRSDRVRIILDPANLVVGVQDAAHRTAILTDAFEKLGPWIIAGHAKDVSPGGFVAPGKGQLDWGEFLRLLARSGSTGPLLIQDASEEEVVMARQMLEGIAASLGG
ncbi:MAG TPA: sugar phosphate isomerase/epimerase [Tepidiformaceae bacterium]